MIIIPITNGYKSLGILTQHFQIGPHEQQVLAVHVHELLWPQRHCICRSAVARDDRLG